MSLIVEKNVSLAPYTTLGLEGKAKYFCQIEDRFQLKELMKKTCASKVPLAFIGRGSNVFFSEGDFDGLVAINRIRHLEIEQTQVKVGSGYPINHLGVKCANLGLAGLEFASGIPGSVGGAICMNAGADGSEVKDTLISCLCVDEEGKFVSVSKEELYFSYRTSILQTSKLLVAEALFGLTKDGQAKERQKQMIERRLATQPYDEKTAGCVFRNPEGISASKLIDDCGLKGFEVGQVAVSKKHANFFINQGKGTAQEMLALIELVQKKVKEQTGYLLKLEVQIIQSRGAVSV